MALIDELTGILGADAVEKIKAAGLAQKIERGETLADYLDKGELPPDPVQNQNQNAGLSLDDLTRTLKTSLTEFETTLTPKLATIAKEQAAQVFKDEAAKAVSGLLADSTRWAHEMTQIERDYKTVTGEDFDDTKLNELNEFAKTTGKPVTSPKAVYGEWIRDKKTEKEIERRAEEKANAKVSSMSVPGVTPGAATGVRAALKKFGSAVNAEGKTRAEVLNEKLAQLERAS